MTFNNRQPNTAGMSLSEVLAMRAEQAQARKGSGLFFQPTVYAKGAQGQDVIRILKPSYMVGPEPWLVFEQYKANLGTTGNGPFYYGAAPAQWGLEDPIAEHCAKLEAQGAKWTEPSSIRSRKNWTPAFTYAMLVSVREADGTYSLPKLWECNQSAFDAMVPAMVNVESAGVEPWDRANGFDLLVRCSKGERKQEWSVSASRYSGPLPNAAEIQEAADQRDLAAAVIVDTPAALREVLNCAMTGQSYDRERFKAMREERDRLEGPVILPMVAASAAPAPRPALPAPKPEPAKAPPRRTVQAAPPAPAEPDPWIGRDVEFDAADDDGQPVAVSAVVRRAAAMPGEYVLEATAPAGMIGEWEIAGSLLRPAAVAKKAPASLSAREPEPDDLPFEDLAAPRGIPIPVVEPAPAPAEAPAEAPAAEGASSVEAIRKATLERLAAKKEAAKAASA